ERVLVFTTTKHGADRVCKDLFRNEILAEAIHGNKSQNARQRALSNFKEGKIRVLVATDIAARGIDVDDLTHVINFDLPNIPETYVHRIGRTGRAGASGIAISFCDAEERPFLRDITKLIGLNIPLVEEHPYKMNYANFAPSAQSAGSCMQNVVMVFLQEEADLGGNKRTIILSKLIQPQQNEKQVCCGFLL
ncbi:MAG: helicase-related protein, partial [Chitinophagaceae bacterium]